MRKNINKIVAFAIGISVMSGSIIPVFAAENAKDNSTNINIVRLTATLLIVLIITTTLH